MTGRRYDVVFYVPSVTPLLTRHALPPPGGAETQVVLLSRALAARGVRVALVVFDVPGVEIPSSFDGVDVLVRPPYRAHSPLTGKLREALRIHATLARIDAPVVVTRMAGAQVGLIGASAKLLRRRFVYSSANVSDFDFGVVRPKRRDLALYQLGIRLADTVVVQTDEQAALCERSFRKRTLLAKSIAEPVPHRPSRPEALLWIGRLVWYKRPLAFVELARSIPEVPCRMVGVPSPSEPDLAERVADEAARVPNLQLLPPRPRAQLLELVDRAVAVVNTADFEGMPNIFLDGWARGIPALALTHDPDGVIEARGLGEFTHGASDALADGARRLWAARDDRAALAERCRRYVAEEHSAEAVVEKWLGALYSNSAPRASTWSEAA